MALVWDAVLVQAVAVELRSRTLGSRLRAVHFDPVGRNALLFFREGTLALRLHPDVGALTLHGATDPLPPARALPCVLEEIVAPPDDRVLYLHLRRRRGRKVPYVLAIELATNQWNAVLVEGEGMQIRRVLREREGERALRPGLVYAPPPPSLREGVDGGLTLERWVELLRPLAPERRRPTLLATVAWTSALNAGALLGEAARGDAAPDALAEGHALWRRTVASPGAPQPVLLRRGAALQPYPLPLPGTDHAPVSSLLAGLKVALGALGKAADAPPLPAAWTAAASLRLERARRRTESLARELETTPDPEAARATGNLLLARFRDVPRGAAEVTLEDFEGRPVRVELDSTRSASENAARYYEMGARAERARERLPGLIARARAEADRLADLVRHLEAGSAGAEDVRAALGEEPARARAGGPPDLPYRTYRSSGGLEIRVGKGARRNDDLTFHHSSPEDVWLHARHAAGAHVILRWSGQGGPPARDLGEAAVLAALHSKARTSGKVPVDWTLRKHVRKPRKARPGLVVTERAKTLFVEPDPALEKRLRQE